MPNRQVVVIWDDDNSVSVFPEGKLYHASEGYSNGKPVTMQVKADQWTGKIDSIWGEFYVRFFVEL